MTDREHGPGYVAEPGWKVTVTNPTDAELVAVVACAGNAGRVRRDRRAASRQVYQLCYRFVGNHEDASDLAQDVFIRAYRGLRKFKGSRRSAPGSTASPSTSA